MKRKDILKKLALIAKEREVELRIIEGSNHTKVWVGDKYTTLPRHKEIGELLAKHIMKQIGE